MARSTWGKVHTKKHKTVPKRTSIGKSKNSRPKNKYKKRVGKNIEDKGVDEKEKSMWVIKYCGS